MTFRRASFAALSTALLLGLAWGCAAAENFDRVDGAAAGGNGSTEPTNDASVIMLEGGPQGPGGLGPNPLCGKADVNIACVPDSPRSCAQFTQPVASGDDAGVNGDAAASGQAGASGEGGSGGDSHAAVDSSGAGEGGAGGTAADPGASGAAGEVGAGGAAGTAGAAAVPPMPQPQYSCQVQRAVDALDEPFSACAPAGPGGESAPCLTASDCQAGLGCVGDQNAGLCQHYCCQDADDCEKGTYCTERPMRDRTTNALARDASSTGTSLMIPVCVHAENCDLSAPYPCPKDGECACASGTACLVVRSDGTTTCAVPGKGKVGEACPCAWGYVCSAASTRCLELCRTRDITPCGTGKCQASSELPDGWGVCIGVTPSGG